MQQAGAISLTFGLQPAISPAVPEPSPTEPNTPSDNGEDAQGSSAERKSFSSLINYDPSSQQQVSRLAFGPISRAEMLRLRLRVAMYKVRTNQIDVPFADLNIEDKDGTFHASSRAVEEAVAQLRREAQAQLEQQRQAAAQRQDVKASSPAGLLKLQDVPVLLPTAYSNRMIYDSGLPSSPPASVSPAKHAHPGLVGTPLPSPGSVASKYLLDEAELTSSVVKGRCAEGLLGLRNAV
jgi:hypothetical protein